jgi:predicted nucleotidyltransferase
LKALTRLGVVETQTIGRAGVHRINEEHASVTPLRALLDPIGTLRDTITAVTRSDVSAVIVFGSIARGDATPDSDIDLAVIAPRGWDGRIELEDAVRRRLGNDCDVLVFGASEFGRLAAAGEPVASDILREGIPLVGAMPRVKHGAA